MSPAEHRRQAARMAKDAELLIGSERTDSALAWASVGLIHALLAIAPERRPRGRSTTPREEA